jgi:hypothetical protein
MRRRRRAEAGRFYNANVEARRLPTKTAHLVLSVTIPALLEQLAVQLFPLQSRRSSQPAGMAIMVGASKALR